MKLFFLLALLSQAALADIRIVSRWVIPRSETQAFELLPQERTRPIIVGDVLYGAGQSGEVYALHRTEGYYLWKRELAGGIDGAFTYARSKIFVGDTQGHLYSLNARDGSDFWPEPFRIRAEWLAPFTVVQDKVFAPSSNNELYVLSESHGKEIWHYAAQPPVDVKMEVRGTAGSAFWPDTILQGFANGYLTALGSNDGRVLWSKKLRTNKPRFYDVDTTPYCDDKVVIVATYEGMLYNLDRSTGNINWTHPIGAVSGFSIDGDRLYVAGLDRKLYALEKNTGQIIWKTPFEEGVGYPPIKVGRYLVMTSSSDPIYVFDSVDGKLVTTVRIGTGSMAPASASSSDNWFYVLSNYGNLYSFEILEGFQEPVSLPSVIRPQSALDRHRD